MAFTKLSGGGGLLEGMGFEGNVMAYLGYTTGNVSISIPSNKKPGKMLLAGINSTSSKCGSVYCNFDAVTGETWVEGSHRAKRWTSNGTVDGQVDAEYDTPCYTYNSTNNTISVKNFWSESNSYYRLIFVELLPKNS